ncbi:MAG: 16S rRNA (guanine(966)-N(2))-methyltransferase RsmD [Oscillospiraceae bacterium]|jgi:16S rRNA (guanine(966)-N(2))-methyltransferase RsmD|nr:16S rRNA (guanine(966)-N(2))-methyltransferase RsmD [Oscillospiraceae bacterium]
MRVVTGTARGRKLKPVPGEATRPTTASVKEAVFSIIQFEIEGRRVLDLFAGTGQLGIEALSRGAAQAVFVDNNSAALAVVRDNLAVTGLEEKAAVVASDALSYVTARPEPFDIILLDPPYRSSLLTDVMARLSTVDILRPGGIIVCETAADLAPPAPPASCVLSRTYRYGTQAVCLYRRDA